MAKSDIEGFWEAVRTVTSESPERATGVQEWAYREKAPLLLVGERYKNHLEAYVETKDPAFNTERSSEWIWEGLGGNICQRLSRVHPVGTAEVSWALLRGLLTIDILAIFDPIRPLVDQGLLYTEVFRTIWEARFLLDEGYDLETLVEVLAEWVSSSSLPERSEVLLERLKINRGLSAGERLDVLFFLTTLARQNDHLPRIVFLLQDLDKAFTQGSAKRKGIVKELESFNFSLDRWSRLGSPCKFLFTYGHDPLPLLVKVRPKLAHRLELCTFGVKSERGR